MRPELLLLAPLDDEYIDRIQDVFPVHYAPWGDLPTITKLGPNVRAVWTNGTVGLTAEAIGALPELQIVHAHGAGYDKINLDAIRQRGIALTNGAGTNDACVADHAMALLLSLVREIPELDARSKAGEWASLRTNRPAIYGKRMGIVGLGRIGSHIARRAAGFDMSIAYHGRRELPGVAYRYYADLVSLAADSDVLVLSCVGGPSTHHIVNAAVLDALGPEGYLVNVARGSVVDTGALLQALTSGRIAAAALDVFDKEPGISEELRAAPNVLLTPHVAGLASQVRDEQIALALKNFQAFFAGQPLQNIVVPPAGHA